VIVVNIQEHFHNKHQCTVIKIKYRLRAFLLLSFGLNRKSSPGNITHVWEFQTLYFLVGVASEANII
jgi:hypothetical protein